MKEMLKLGLTLAIFAAVACVALAFVNNLTAPTIAKVEQEKANAGMKTVCIPTKNEKDLDEISVEIKEGLKIVLVDKLEQVLEVALVR